MLKATLKRAVLLAIVAIGLLAVSRPGFAEVQNIKVGGDETLRGFWRSNLDLRGEEDPEVVANALDGHDDFFMNTLGINVNANLTENVEVEVRIANERDLGTTGAANGDIDLSRANVKIKDIFYSPFTLTAGTFPVSWGRGFVLGSSLVPGILATGNDRNASITANEFTDFTSFDGLRLKGEFGGTAAMSMPLSVDLVYLKIAEGLSGVADDTNLLGFNVGTRFDKGEAEIYYLLKANKSPAITSTTSNDNHGAISTLGIRGSAKPTESSNVYGELAYQFGQRDSDPSTFGLTPGDAQQAWAFDLGADVTLADVATKPMLGAEWIFFSGKDSNACTTTYCGGVPGWDPIAKGYFTTVLRDFQTSSGVAGLYAPDQAGVTGSQTNQHQLSLYGSFKPLEDLTIAPRLSWFILDRGIRPIALNTATNFAQEKKANYVGMEWDTQATYNYTDDVQFGLIYALFTPGNVFLGASGFDSTAQELISSVSVKF